MYNELMYMKILRAMSFFLRTINASIYIQRMLFSADNEHTIMSLETIEHIESIAVTFFAHERLLSFLKTRAIA